jgi:hypothetical protein
LLHYPGLHALVIELDTEIGQRLPLGPAAGGIRVNEWDLHRNSHQTTIVSLGERRDTWSCRRGCR